jgi:hypothetical protein
MSKSLTVEQMVRKCFCPASSKDVFVKMLYGIVAKRSDVLHLARAARRFVRLEERQKNEIKPDKLEAAVRKGLDKQFPK